MTPEERLTKLANDVKLVRERGQPRSFPDVIKSEAISLMKFFGSNGVVKGTNLTPSLLYKWQKIITSNNVKTKDPTLKITHCVIPKKEFTPQKSLITFVKNGIKCKMYNEALAIKIIGEFLK